MPAPLAADHRSRIVLVGAAILLVLVAVVIVWRLPRSSDPVGFAASPTEIDTGIAVVVLFQIDSIDAQNGTASVRVSAVQGPAMPAVGVEVLVGRDASHTLTVTPDADSRVETVVFDFDRGSVTQYPFDRYRISEPVSAVARGADPHAGPDDPSTLAIDILGNASAFGFEVQTAHAGLAAEGSRFDLEIQLERTQTHRLWASAMMAIFWALALSALVVVVSVVWRARVWETRHFAWLTATIFALAAFRTTAPGDPPLGVFMDTAAFFWAEAIVVLCLVALVVVFATRGGDELE